MSMNGNGRWGVSHRHDHMKEYAKPSRVVIEARIARCLRAAKLARKSKDIPGLLKLNARHTRLLELLKKSI